jgi:hypothetical protein
MSPAFDKMAFDVLELGGHVADNSCAVDLFVRVTVKNQEWPSQSTLLEKSRLVLCPPENQRSYSWRKIARTSNPIIRQSDTREIQEATGVRSPPSFDIKGHIGLRGQSFNEINASLQANGSIICIL